MQRSSWKNKLLLLCLTVILLLGLCACKGEESSDPAINADSERERITMPGNSEYILSEEVDQVQVWYADTESDNLVPLSIPINPTLAAPAVAIEKLLAGAPNEWVRSTVPENTKVLGLWADDLCVYLNLTTDILYADEETAALAIRSLVYTLDLFDPELPVQILVNSEIWDEIGGIQTGEPLSVERINDYSKGSENAVTVWFANESASYLVPVTVAATEKTPEAAVKALLAGPPAESKLSPSFGQGVQLLDLSVDYGVATVDFNEALLDYGGGSTQELILLHSLQATLGEFDGIREIQLLVEDAKLDYLPEGSSILSPIPTDIPLNNVQ